MRHSHPYHPAAPERSHCARKRTDGERCSLAIGSAIRATEAKAFVATLDKLSNEQLADVLAFIFGKLCPNYHSRQAGRE